MKLTEASKQAGEAQHDHLRVPATSEFKRKSVRGGAAVILGQGAGMALQLGTTFVLARLLSPSDFGLQGMVFTLTAVLSLFRDAGLSTASVQRDNLTQEQISNLFWINVAIGAVLMVLIVALAPFLAKFYREPRLVWITIASSTIFLFSSLSVQHNALLNRSMRFGTTVTIDILNAVIGAVVAIGMAALGFGYWSLICQNISLAVVATVATWIAMPWLPGKPSRMSDVRPLVRFGGTVTLNSVVVYFAYNADKILLGRFWGANALGIYGRAYQLINLPVQQLWSAVGRVAVPVLSRMQNDAAMLHRSYLRFHSVVISMTIPIVFSCALFADEIVRVVLGAKWAACVLILRLLAPTAFVLAVIDPLDWLLWATGMVGRNLKIGLLITPVVILGVIAGLHHGAPGVALGYSTAMILLLGPVLAWAKHKTGITTRDYWDLIKRPALAGIVGASAGWLARLAFHAALAPVFLLAVELTVNCAVYAGLLLFVMGEKRVYADIVSQLFQRQTPAAAKG